MSQKGVLKGGIIGVVIGAVSGILLAPKSGKETREDIKAAAVRANREAEKRLKQLHVDLKVLSEELLKDAEALKGKARAEYDDLVKRAEIVRGKISETISSVRDFEAEDKDVESAIAQGETLVEEIHTKRSKKA